MARRPSLGLFGILSLLVATPARPGSEPPGVKLARPTIEPRTVGRVVPRDEDDLRKLAAIRAREIRFPGGAVVEAPDGLDPRIQAPLEGVYVVQYPGPIERAWREELEATGVVIHDYFDSFVYLVEVPPRASAAVVDMTRRGRIRHVGPYLPELRLERRLREMVTRGERNLVSVTVRLFHPATEQERAELLRWLDLRMEVDDPAIPFVRGLVTTTDLTALASYPFVRYVEPFSPGHLHNLESAMSGAGDQVVGWGTYTGAGIRVSVDDTGLTQTGSSTECGASGAAWHPDLPSSRVLYDWDYQNGDTNSCDDHGHGTHTTGTIGGAGTNTDAWTGMAPGASFVIFKDCCSSGGSTGFLHFTNVLSDSAYWGANVVANSWGGNNGVYDVNADAADKAVRGTWLDSGGSPQYMNVTISAGNEQFTIAAPGVSKSAITVGAMRGGNWANDGGDCLCTFGGTSCRTDCDFNSDNDPSCNAVYSPPTDIVCYSNQGPLDTDGDGKTRVKPDVVMPGTKTVSAAPAHLEGGALYVEKSGTSMAQPGVAGTIALMLDAYPSVIDWPSMIKAKLLATAVDLGSRARFGHGMVDALHAVYDDAELDTVLWTGSTITGTGDQNDHFFNVPAGFREVRVYLVSDDPASTTEVVNDLDLYVYDAGGTIVQSSVADDDPVEYVRTTSGTAGSNWRANVRGFNVAQAPQWYGIVAVVVLENPAIAIQASASKSCLRPSEAFSISTTLSNPGRTVVGSQIQLDLPVAPIVLQNVLIPTDDPGRDHTYLGSELYLDGALNRYSLATGAVTPYTPRSATWNLYVPAGSSNGSQTLEVFGSAMGQSNVSMFVPLTIDGTAPGNVSSLTSTNHALNSCSNNASVTMTWTAAGDGSGCGIDGYGVYWSLGSPQPPGTTKDIESVTTYTESLTPSLSAYYFNIRAVDNAGNWSATYASYGPFFVETTVPSNVTNLASTTHDVDDCGPTSATFQWTAATDLPATCGIDGYSVTLTSGAPAIPNTTKDIEEVTSYSTTVTPSAAPWYFNIRTVDAAGNWAPTYASFGPFYVQSADAAFSTNAPVCQGNPVQLTGPAGYASYRWTFGDGDCLYGVKINEVNTGNVDFVELFNAGGEKVNLQGFTLSWNDTIGGSGSFTLPSFVLAPGGYVQLVENTGTGDATHVYLGANIGWTTPNGGSCSLLGETGLGIDFVRFGGSTTPPPTGTGWNETGILPTPQNVGESLSRDDTSADKDGSSDWCIQAPTPTVGLVPAVNTSCAAAPACQQGGCRSGVVVNEIHVGNTDALELYNTGNTTVALGSWQLQWTDTLPSSGTFSIAAFNLAPGAYVLLIENSGTNDATHLFLGANLPWDPSRGGSLALVNTSGVGVDFVRWGGSTIAPPSGTSWSEPVALPSPALTQSLSRTTAGTDRGTSSDWCLQAPTSAPTNPGPNTTCAGVAACPQTFLQSQSHTYASPGTYPVTLTVATDAGCSDDHATTVTVGAAITAAPSGSPNPAVLGRTVSFLANRGGGTAPFTYAWTFGDGGTSTLQNPTHLYASAGPFSVNLAISDAAGCAVNQGTTVQVVPAVKEPSAQDVTPSVPPLRLLSGTQLEVEEIPGATAYDVYWGALGNYTQFTAACDVTATSQGNGKVTLDFTVPPDGWVVVAAADALSESSLGRRSSGTERDYAGGNGVIGDEDVETPSPWRCGPE